MVLRIPDPISPTVYVGSLALKIVLKFKNMKAIELIYASGVMGTEYSHYSSDIIIPGEKLYTRDGEIVKVHYCNTNNESTSIDTMPAYKCKVEGLNGSAMLYDREMLEHLNR